MDQGWAEMIPSFAALFVFLVCIAMGLWFVHEYKRY